MDLIADTLLVAASMGAAAYCFILSRRLRRFTKLETGMGGAIAALSGQVDEMTRALNQAQAVAVQSEKRLSTLAKRGDDVAGRLELMLASLHDLPVSGAAPTVKASPTRAPNTPFFKNPMPKPEAAPAANAALRAKISAPTNPSFSPPPRLGDPVARPAAPAPVTRRFVRRRFDASLSEVPG